MKKIILGGLVLMMMQFALVSAEMVKVYPSDDSYTNERYPSTNYGSADNIWIGYNPNTGRHKSYLKFDIHGVSTAGLRSAVLSIDRSSGDETDPPRVNLYSISDGWSESTITWDNAPEGGVFLGYADGITAFRTTYDISSVLSDPDKILSFALVSNNPSNDWSYVKFHSKDNIQGDYIERKFYSPYLLFDYGPNNQYPVINEFQAYPEEGEYAWVEFYNPTNSNFDLTDCELYDGGSILAILNGTIPSRGFGYYDLKRNDGSPLYWLGHDGDKILLQCGDTILDQVIYGEAYPLWDPDGNANNAPAAGQGQSVGRAEDGVDTDQDNVDFVVFTMPTKDGPNGQTCNTEADTDCNGCVSQSEITTYAFMWLSGDPSITQAQVTLAAYNWLNGINSC